MARILMRLSVQEIHRRDRLVVVHAELLHELAHAQVPDLYESENRGTYVDVAVVARAGEDLLVELVDGADAVEVDVLQVQDRLLLPRVPDVDAAVDGRRDEEVRCQGAEAADAALFEAIGCQRLLVR